MAMDAGNDIPQWRVAGDWFDVCKCNIPCPCYFAQPPTYGDCEGMLAWHIREGSYDDVRLDGLNLVAVAAFEGNIWDGETKATMALFLDERADHLQRLALQMVFGGQAGGWPGYFSEMIGEVRGVEYARIEFEVADDLAYWRAEILGKVVASAEALAGPTTLPGQLVQVHNPPGSEVGPGQPPATQGRSIASKADAFGFAFEWDGRSSKHIPFDWSVTTLRFLSGALRVSEKPLHRKLSL